MKRIRGKCSKCDNPTAAYKAVLCSICEKERRSVPHTKQEYRRNWSLQKKYNLEPIEFDTIWIAFHGKCGICNNILKRPTPTRGQALDVVAIDHDHKTGNIRGLLCNGCNKGLGLFKDNIKSLELAIKWLRMSRKNEKISDDSTN